MAFMLLLLDHMLINSNDLASNCKSISLITWSTCNTNHLTFLSLNPQSSIAKDLVSITNEHLRFNTLNWFIVLLITLLLYTFKFFNATVNLSYFWPIITTLKFTQYQGNVQACHTWNVTISTYKLWFLGRGCYRPSISRTTSPICIWISNNLHMPMSTIK